MDEYTIKKHNEGKFFSAAIFLCRIRFFCQDRGRFNGARLIEMFENHNFFEKIVIEKVYLQNYRRSHRIFHKKL